MEEIIDRLTRIAKNLNPNDYEDLVQSALEKALRRKLPFDLPLLTVVLKDVHYDRIRYDKLRRNVPEFKDEVDPKYPDELSSEMEAALDSLSEKEKSVFLAYYLQNDSVPEIAHRHEYAVQTVYNILSTARGKLQKALKS